MAWALPVAARAKAWVAATAASAVTVEEFAEKVAAGATELGMAGIGAIATAVDTVTAAKTAEKMAAAAAAAVAMAVVMTAAVDVAELVVANNWTAAAVPARTVRGMHLFVAGTSIFYSPQVREARYP